jgi:glucose/mannose transport system permease protein
MLTSEGRSTEHLRPPTSGGRLRAAPAGRRFDARHRDRLLAILVVSPSLLAVAVFVYLFILWTGYASTIDWTTIFPDYTFVGLDNYREVVTDERFRTDLRNLVLFSASFMAQCIVIGFVLAVLLNQRIKGEAFFRTIYILPFAVSLIVTGVAWHWLMQPTTGINLILQAIGLGSVQPSWYTSSDWGILAVSTANAWQMSGYIMAIYLAGLRGIPQELVEAARIDGCGNLVLYRRVIIPLLTPVTFTAVLLTGMVSVKTFDILATMTGGGPGFATDMLGLFMYDLAFQSNLFARSASVAVIMMLIAGLLLIPYVMSTRRRERMGLG